MSSELILGRTLLEDVEVIIQQNQVTIKRLLEDDTDKATPNERVEVSDMIYKKEEITDTINNKDESRSATDEEGTLKLSGEKIIRDEVEERQLKNEIEELILIKCSDPRELDVVEPYRSRINQIIQDYRPRKEVKTSVRTKITLTDENPINLRPQRLAPKEKQILDEQIKEWLKQGIIRPSKSDFASPIVIVPKKNGVHLQSVHRLSTTESEDNKGPFSYAAGRRENRQSERSKSILFN